MREKLKLREKLCYGIGDFGSNMTATFVGAFILLYLTTSLGMDVGIIGTLMLVSKLFDGVSDIFFGTLVDHTHSKMGKARPWMFWTNFLCGAGIVAVFSIPAGLGSKAQYAFFFITYTLLNAVFYTANNIAYSTISALMTTDGDERVQLGTFRYIFPLYFFYGFYRGDYIFCGFDFRILWRRGTRMENDSNHCGCCRNCD